MARVGRAEPPYSPETPPVSYAYGGGGGGAASWRDGRGKYLPEWLYRKGQKTQRHYRRLLRSAEGVPGILISQPPVCDPPPQSQPLCSILCK